MKKIVIILIVIVQFATSCKNNKKEAETGTTTAQSLPPVNDATLENAVIYEANIRQYSPEGTFNAFTKDIPELKKLGVKIIWVMPVYPISMKRRKATGDKSIEDITDPEEKKKYLGSYYAISDYTAVNPDFGTPEDFQNLVKTAHDNGMYVILDWVANHTGWDHKWITEHPEYYQKNAKGEVTDPLNPETGEPWGWTDVAHLDYANKKVYEPMKEEMMYWVKEQNIDGFRCDVADNVPTEFWEWAIPQLEKQKPLFMLMESDKDYLLKNAFDMGYGWVAHHLMNDIVKGTKKVADWDVFMQDFAKKYQADDIFMNFITNHDENAWNGSEYERLGNDAVKAFAALEYTMPGMPLIYTGQEYGNQHRLKFFEKDVIAHDDNSMFAFYEKLGKLKNENPALNGGKQPASYKRLDAGNPNVLAFEREKDGKKVVYIANLSKNAVTFTTPVEGAYRDYMEDRNVKMEPGKELKAKPWEYWVLTY